MNQFQNYTFDELVAVVTDDLTREELADYHDEIIIRQEQLELQREQTLRVSYDD